MNNSMLWITLACNAMCIFAFTITPFVTRKTELFGISLPSSEIKRPELSAFRRVYLICSLITGAVLIVLTFVLFRVEQYEMLQVRWFLIMLFAYIGIVFLIYLYFHNRMKVFKEGQPWRDYGLSEKSYSVGGAAKPAPHTDTVPAGREVLHPVWLLLFVAVALGTLIYLWAIWPSLPKSIPMHMNAAGAIDGWMAKGPSAFIAMLFGQWILISVFVLVYFMIPYTKPQIDAAKPHESHEQGRRFRYIMSACMVFCGSALAAIIGFVPVVMAQGEGGATLTTITLLLVFAVIVVMFIVVFRTGQGGSRLNVGAEPAGSDELQESADLSETESEGGPALHFDKTDDDRFWKLGQFYFNPADRSIMVEKRFGIGWTINFGHPVSWIVLAGIIALVVVVLAVSLQGS